MPYTTTKPAARTRSRTSALDVYAVSIDHKFHHEIKACIKGHSIKIETKIVTKIKGISTRGVCA